jgi:predicted Fe-Mo cluster-binding NifX family protein
MNVCLPSMADTGLDAPLHGHFGSAAFFTIVDTESRAVRVLPNGNQHHAHGQCQPLRALAGESIDAVVTGGMGRRAVGTMNEEGIRVFQAVAGTVADAVDALAAGRLPELTPDRACGGHGHGHGHGNHGRNGR